MHLNRWNRNSFIHSFIYSGYFYSASSSPLCTTQRRSRHSTDTVREFQAEAPQATVSEVLDQGPYVAARAGLQVIDFYHINDHKFLRHDKLYNIFVLLQKIIGRHTATQLH